jgi:tetratricopeptide (TPR) repeat protein
MALVYDAIGQRERALELYEQALPMLREVGDRVGEARTLNNMGEVYRMTGQPERALMLYEQTLPILHEIGAVGLEAAALLSLAITLHDGFGQTAKAIDLMTCSVEILTRHNLPQDASGTTLAQHQEFLATLCSAFQSMQIGASSAESSVFQMILRRALRPVFTVLHIIRQGFLPTWKQ